MIFPRDAVNRMLGRLGTHPFHGGRLPNAAALENALADQQPGH